MPDARLAVDFTTMQSEVVDYSIVLILVTSDGRETIRVYDGAHGFNEIHRYTRVGGKQNGKEFHSGTLGEGMRVAIAAIKKSYREMIEGWRNQ